MVSRVNAEAALGREFSMVARDPCEGGDHLEDFGHVGAIEFNVRVVFPTYWRTRNLTEVARQRRPVVGNREVDLRIFAEPVSANKSPA